MTAVLEAVGAQQAFPGQARLLRRRPRRRCARSTASRSRSSRAGRSASSANCGCGKTTTAKLVLGLEQPTGGSIRFEGKDLQELDAAGRRHYRKSVQAVFQDPYASLNPRMRISAIIAEPLVTNEKLDRGRGAPARARAARPGRPAGARRRPVPARILRRAAAAHRDRPGAGAVAEADRARRAGLGARRVDPRADPQPAARPAGRAGAVLSVHRPRPRRGRAYEPRRSWSCISAGSSRAAKRRTLARAPKHPYTEALFSAALPSHPDERREEIILPRRGAEPAQPAVGLPLPPALPAGDAAMRRAGPRASGALCRRPRSCRPRYRGIAHRRAAGFYGEAVQWDRIGVTWDQVEAMDLARYGSEVEGSAQAVPVPDVGRGRGAAPRVLLDLLENAIGEYVDHDQLEVLRTVEAEERSILTALDWRTLNGGAA